MALAAARPAGAPARRRTPAAAALGRRASCRPGAACCGPGRRPPWPRCSPAAGRRRGRRARLRRGGRRGRRRPRLERLAARRVASGSPRCARRPRRRADADVAGGAGRRRPRPMRTLRPRRWWLARGGAPAWCRRSSCARPPRAPAASCSSPPPPPAPAGAAAAASTRPDIVVRIHDDLSLGNSFAWISASIALALARPRRARLDRADRAVRLLRPRAARAPGDADRARPGAGARRRRDGLDALLAPVPAAAGRAGPARRSSRSTTASAAATRRLRPVAARADRVGAAAGADLGASAATCSRDAGVAGERLRIVPMGVTDGIPGAGVRRAPRRPRLKLLHVTNAADLERNGTELALEAFADALRARRRRHARRARLRLPTRRRPRTAARARRPRLRRPLLARRSSPSTGSAASWARSTRCSRRSAARASASSCSTPWPAGSRRSARSSAARATSSPTTPPSASSTSSARCAPATTATRLALGNDPQWAEPSREALAAALRAALEHPAELERRGQRARERALGGFTWRHTAERIVALLGG